MQVQAPRAYPSSTSTSTSTSTAVSVTGALRVVEAFLLGGGQQTARRNAWSAVLEDRRRAKDRRDAQHVLNALNSKRAASTGLLDVAGRTDLTDRR